MNELLWSPKDESISSSNLSKFYSYIEDKFNTSFNSNYELLWKWSIQHKNDFWPSLIEFLKIDFLETLNQHYHHINSYTITNFFQTSKLIMLKIFSIK
jgi:hypothetical protein